MAKLKRNGIDFHCSNCHMKIQPQEGMFPMFCFFCGEPLTNIEEIQADLFMELENNYRLEVKQDDDTIHRT